jgi:hypothetical protein
MTDFVYLLTIMANDILAFLIGAGFTFWLTKTKHFKTKNPSIT